MSARQWGHRTAAAFTSSLQYGQARVSNFASGISLSSPVPRLAGTLVVKDTISARSVALAGFALDSLIEIGACTAVIWELSGPGEERQRRGLRLIGYAFAALAVYLLVQSTMVLVSGYHPDHLVPGIVGQDELAKRRISEALCQD
jgi:hypothetical protein